MDLNRWWTNRSTERFWLEVTDRLDIGVDLKAPQRDERGRPYWSYALVREVSSGDVVFHYDKTAQAIIGSSQATGDHWDDRIVWGARGTSARGANVTPRERPGYYCGLLRFAKLPAPISLSSIRAEESAIASSKQVLTAEVGDPLYFPFAFSEDRPIRPGQGYLFKLPAFFLSLFPELTEFIHQGAELAIEERDIGSEYRRADEEQSVGAFDPMEVDPAVVERGTRGHAITQNALADFLKKRGLQPRSPNESEPSFDLAWQDSGRIWVAEVKSITNRNEERQLRMGLGQVLQYRFQLSRQSSLPVTAVVAVERRPPDVWIRICDELGVFLVWPGGFELLEL